MPTPVQKGVKFIDKFAIVETKKNITDDPNFAVISLRKVQARARNVLLLTRYLCRQEILTAYLNRVIRFIKITP